MITFIIPTLWKSKRIFDTISQFIESDLQDIELIIIDNGNSEFESSDPRVKFAKQERNIFVNPAWNLGVSLSSNDYVCIMNDDITINVDLFIRSFFKEIINKDNNFGMLAVNPDEFLFSSIVNRDEDKLIPRRILNRGYGFGQLMVFHKSTYEPIPPQFNVYFGDDVQWFVNNDLTGRNNWCFSNLKIKGEMSVTSSMYEQQGLIQEELKYWNDCVDFLRAKYNKL